ncbi:acetate--CoA ligase family protein [Pseudarthrobacter sp. NIBRBAC000502772]|uniref:acetate--CoA ligase family protein n=1 Tax=Pseudarthrobacter sp. NIBRBAC000502772 TaxID=2590775 RepID=UPI001131BFFC|nr:acetate--CoA ligase family protein [Pseudarthrobacter sp. NIBRBAC000502772]QDG65237.1 acetate--CoA ligase family protein [Pseudarthrobacter sp. NIBRBAC000502772]
MHSLSSLFAPRGIIVVGASSSPEKLGAVMAQSLSSYPAPVELVNSRGENGMHTSIAEAAAAIPGGPDLAVLCVPAAATAQALRDSAANGAKAALVCAGGFAEAGGPGIEFASQVEYAVRETGIRLLGPNTSGFFVPHRNLRASFVPGVAELEPGSVAVVAASGGVNHVLAFHLQRSGAGVSLAAGIGAGTDITAPDVLDYLITDDQTKAVALHLETVSDGPALVDAVSRLSAVKPVVALVVGRNDVSEFAQSHTGALATSWRTTRSVLQQAGAVIVDDENQLVAAVTALAGRRLQPAADPGVGLITGQAGPGLLIADALHSAGVTLPRLAQSSQDTIGALLPPLTFQANPVDTGRPGPGYEQIVAAVSQDPAIDLVALYGLTEPVTDLPLAVANSGAAETMPFLIGVDGPDGDLERARKSARQHNLPLITGPTSLAHGIAAVVNDARGQFQRAQAAEGSPAWPDVEGPWDENRSKELLGALGIATPERRVCSTRDAAQEALAELGGPVAVKLLDATVLHKTEIGGVHLGVKTAEEMDRALAGLEAVGAREFLVEAMAPSGVDLVVGVRRDPVFGPIVVLGLGGTAAEVFADISIRTAPLALRAAESMPAELQARELLYGFRSGPMLDTSELAGLLVRLGDALVSNEAVAEIEINPLRLTHNGLLALDAVVINVEEDIQ